MDNTGIPVNMPVMPANYGGGFGDFGSSGWWIILLFLFAGGFGGFGGYGMGNGAGFVGADVQRGFDQSAVMTGLSGVQNSITSGFGDLQTALCGGFANVNANITNGFAQAEIGENARQMANMNQMYGIQTSISNGIRDIIASQTANTERILGTMCQDKIDAKNEKILELQNSLNMANLSASQTAQTATILAALTTTTPAVV
jgi:hypothetical protein